MDDDEDDLNLEDSSTPTPGANPTSRNGTANSVRRLQQPSAMHPTLLEVSLSIKLSTIALLLCCLDGFSLVDQLLYGGGVSKLMS